MRNSIKAALAATTGAALLLGGAGSLAYWSDEEVIPGGTINGGSLDLTSADCGVGWELNGEGVTFNFSRPLVPGDVLTKTCSYVLDATGDNLQADVAASAPDFGAVTALTAELDFSSSFTLDAVGAPAPAAFTPTAQITEADDGKELIASLIVDFDFISATNASNSGVEYNAAPLQAALEDITITVTQTNATP
jgi:alternate signal-mediated exported protein